MLQNIFLTYGTKYSVPRMVLMAKQCSDCEGPCLPPDVVDGQDIGAWPAADRGQEYNSRLVASKAAKVGGRHYAKACLHSQLPEDCLIVGGRDTPQVDIVVDIAGPLSGSEICFQKVMTPLSFRMLDGTSQC